MHPIFNPERIGSLSPETLESFLKQQRWYGAKAKRLVEHKVLDAINLESRNIPLVIVLVETRFDDDSKEIYQLVLGGRQLLDDDLDDALSDARACQALYEVIRDHDEFRGLAGRVQIIKGSRFQHDHFPLSSIQPLSQEQSNSSVVFGDNLFLKLFRNIVFGLNPDFEINLFLMRHPAFHHSPKIFAALEYEGQAHPATLAFIQEYIRAEDSGLAFATKAVEQYLDSPSVESLNAFAGPAKQLGGILAELHLALASDEQDPAFSPEPLTERDASEWWSSINGRLEQTDPCFEGGEKMLLQLWHEIGAAFRSLEPVDDPGMKIRTHGDYHLGQVLRARGEWFILDFEGEPNRPLEERRRKMSPLRDVAIMMRSFNYVAHTVVFERDRPGSPEWESHQTYANRWEKVMRAAFLEGYYDLMRNSEIIPRKEADRRRLLNVFEMDRAVTELSYDINNRPDWTHICLHSIRRILGFAEGEADD